VVRKLAGFEFVGTGPQFTGYTMFADIDGLEGLNRGFCPTPDGLYVRMRTDGHVSMMDFDGGAFDRSQPPTRERLQEVLRRVSGVDLTIDKVHLASTYTDRAMQVTTYRKGRVLVAGDAAHIHSPLGGQGLNSGLGDAMNLGWKLAATVHGTAPDGLLDTYTNERHPFDAWVLDWTRAQVATLRPDAHGRAIQSVLRDLLNTEDGAQYVVGKLSGAWIRYDLGTDDPFVGRLAPEFHFTDGTRLADHTRSGQALLLDFTNTLTTPSQDRLRHLTAQPENALGLESVLIRPDGIIAWTNDHPTLQHSTERWLGVPTS
jgi:2-polyprenyl-6-methoxyphenol hydroxylase-like FAD-dependent oxidoreductase